MKKKYIIAFCSIIVCTVLSLIISFMVYVKIALKPVNNIFYSSIGLKNINTEYYLAGTITNRSSLKFDDLCINIVLKDSNNKEYTYIVMYGKVNDKKIAFQNNVSGEEFAKRTDITVKNVYLRNTYEGTDMEIYKFDQISVLNIKIYGPFYFCLFISASLVIALLVVAIMYSKYKTNLHSVSKSIKTKNFRTNSLITCKYCGFATTNMLDKCPKCGSNILKL